MKWQELLTCCRERGLQATGYATVREAYDAAADASSPSDSIYVGGSTFIVADFLTNLPTNIPS